MGQRRIGTSPDTRRGGLTSLLTLSPWERAAELSARRTNRNSDDPSTR